MSRLRTLVIFSACSTLLSAGRAFAGPFTDNEKIGDLMMVMAPAYALGMTVMDHDWKGSLQLAESIFVSQMVVEGIKMLELEERPNGTNRESFPSGHAAGVFSAAMFVHKRYGWKPAIVPYVMAGITGWSRVHVKAHYWHDVLAGAAVSALFTWVFVDKYVPENISVSADPESVQLRFRFSF